MTGTMGALLGSNTKYLVKWKNQAEIPVLGCFFGKWDKMSQFLAFLDCTGHFCRAGGGVQDERGAFCRAGRGVQDERGAFCRAGRGL
jgi:hypothetical protein